MQLVSSARDSTIRTWRPDIKAALDTAPEDQLPPPVEYFSSQTIRVSGGNVTALAFSRKGMLASGSDDHVISLWNLDSVSSSISVVWTSRGKIDVHDGTPTASSKCSVTFVNFLQQVWSHAWCGAAQPVRMYYSPAAQTARSRCRRVYALFQRVICSLSQQVWQLADGNFRSGAVQTARRHQSGVSSLAVSTSGSRLVSCSSEGTIIWGVQANRITLLCSCCVPTLSLIHI